MYPAILYHAGCADGFGAAYAAWNEFGDEAYYVPVQYSESIPKLSSDVSKVYIFDFSFDLATMEEFHNKYGVKNVILLDHHKTALDRLKGVPNCHIDLDHSGAYLAWKHFNPNGNNVPNLIRYVQDRDLWLWKLPDSREISAYIASFEFDFNQWENLHTDLYEIPNECAKEGASILRFQQKQVESIATKAYWRDIGGYHVPMVNSSTFQSNIGERMLELNPDAPFVGIYFENATDRIWSLRSRPDFDVSEVAKKFDGGGHPQSSGFKEAK